MEALDLESLGVDEVDKGVCGDTFENRRALREAGLKWRVVPPDSRVDPPTGLIEPYTPGEEGSMRQRVAYEKFRDILTDPKDAWSDYLDPREYPLDVEAVPFWIYRRVEAHRAWLEKGRLGTRGGTKEPLLPRRCVHLKADGTRCWSWAADKAGDGRCRAHAPGAAIAADMGHQIMLARVKVMQAMPAMVDELEALALSAVSEQVKLKAVTEMMDRGGVRAGVEVDISGGLTVTGPEPSEAIRGRLAELAERLAHAPAAAAAAIEGAADEGEIVDAVIVDEPREETA